MALPTRTRNFKAREPCTPTGQSSRDRLGLRRIIKDPRTRVLSFKDTVPFIPAAPSFRAMRARHINKDPRIRVQSSRGRAQSTPDGPSCMAKVAPTPLEGQSWLDSMHIHRRLLRDNQATQPKERHLTMAQG